MKARIHKTWDPSGVLNAHDPNRTQFGARDRLVILEVTLDAAGGISAMRVRRTSGLDFLDEAAMEAFRRAAPFDPPPPALLGKDGTVLFPFGFYVEREAASIAPAAPTPASQDRASPADVPSVERDGGGGDSGNSPR